MDLKVLIADDDEGMRLVLRKSIEKTGGYEIVGEAKDGEAALRMFDEIRPHVVFLDVEMPLVNGIECAKKISDINPRTVVVFATAHEEYMPEAFEVYAFDYLVKPFRLERLKQTLERIKEKEGIEFSQKRIAPSGRTPEKLIIRNKEGISLVDMEDIILIQREERTTAIYTVRDRFTSSEGLSELEDRLDKSIFFRCHKSYIINLKSITKIYPYGRWSYVVKLKDTDKDALLTHERYVDLERLFQ